MSIHRRAAKRDENEPEIVKMLRAHGCVVWILSGTGITDLLVMRNGRTWLADVKMPGKRPTKPQEELWEEAATKARVAVFILHTPKEAEMMIASALPPWEPAHIARGKASAAAYGVVYDAALDAAGLRQPSTVKGKRKPGTNSKRGREFYEAMQPGYTPPRQPPGAPREAEVFAPDNSHCSWGPCGHSALDHPAIFSDGPRPCALCPCAGLERAT